MPDDTLVADPPAPAPDVKPPMSTGDKVRFGLRGVGQTLITLGLVVLLFVVYEVWITDLFSRAANNKIERRLAQLYADPTLPDPGAGNSAIPLGTGIANIYMPRLGRDYHWTIVQGTDQNDLAKGPGHYVNSQLPGQKGNFAVAGHRVGKGAPFLNIDQLKSGDTVIVETKAWWYVYKVLGTPEGMDPEKVTTSVSYLTQPGASTTASVALPGREIVDPSAGRVLAPVPDHTNIQESQAVDQLMTMTTCHPKFTAENRMIVYSKLFTQVAPVMSNGKRVEQMPPAISALYSSVST